MPQTRPQTSTQNFTDPSNRIPFALCEHTTPPVPRPFSRATTSHSRLQPTYRGRCLSCDVSYRKSTQRLILDHYNGLIEDQRRRLLAASDRKGLGFQMRYDERFKQDVQRQVDELRRKRDQEIADVWHGFVAMWDGGVLFKEWRDRDGRLDAVAQQLRVSMERMTDGGWVLVGIEDEYLRV